MRDVPCSVLFFVAAFCFVITLCLSFPPRQTSHWLEILQALVLSPNVDLQHRGAAITLNLMNADRELAALLMDSEMMEIMSTLAKDGDEKKSKVSATAKDCLKQAVEYGLIKPSEEGSSP